MAKAKDNSPAVVSDAEKIQAALDADAKEKADAAAAEAEAAKVASEKAAADAAEAAAELAAAEEAERKLAEHKEPVADPLNPPAPAPPAPPETPAVVVDDGIPRKLYRVTTRNPKDGIDVKVAAMSESDAVRLCVQACNITEPCRYSFITELVPVS